MHGLKSSMSKKNNTIVMARNRVSMESEDEVHATEDDQRGHGIQESLLVDDQRPEASVNRWHIPLLTSGVGGLQVVWSVILSNGSPFLVSLGLSKSLTALVWVAAPLCGVVVQPLIGILSDRTRSRWGRRRPFVVAGAIGIIITMLALAWVEDIFHGFTKALTGGNSKVTTRTPIILIATLLIYALNICIQPLQAGLRTLIVENCPAHQQTQASAWASSMTGVGNIVGYLAGFTELPNITSKHLTQFQCLCILASLSLIVTISMSCSIKEQNLPHVFPVRLERTGCAVIVKDLIHTYRSMPRRIRKVCHIQVFAWMGWFPFLFYSTTYVGEFYAGRDRARNLSTSRPGSEARVLSTETLPVSFDRRQGLSPEAIRFGTFASFLSAIVAFLTNIILPMLLRPSKGKESTRRSHSSGRRIPQAWACAHAFFALAMFSTFFATSEAAATFIVASAGLSWALTLWAPFAIIGNELALHTTLHDAPNVIVEGDDAPSSMTSEVQAGAVMGLHNVAISAPQIVAALACSGIFGLAKVVGSPYGTGWVLRAGGLAALGAAYLTYRFEQ